MQTPVNVIGRGIRELLLAAACLALLASPGPLRASPDVGSSAAPAGGDRVLVDALLDDFHAAAAAADRDRYLGHFSPRGVFMGTDDWERWPLPDFTRYVETRFSNGGGWSYESTQRHVDFAPDGDTAWFDEIMVSPRWGRFRGTGVLLRLSGEWKLAHYSLTALIPNERFEAVSAIANEGFRAREDTTAKEQ